MIIHPLQTQIYVKDDKICTQKLLWWDWFFPMQTANPFKFKYVTPLTRTRDLEGVGPCVVMATPSMLQSGISRELFEAWCGDPKNGVIIADFAVQGTLAREILGAPEYIMNRGGARVSLDPSGNPKFTQKLVIALNALCLLRHKVIVQAYVGFVTNLQNLE